MQSGGIFPFPRRVVKRFTLCNSSLFTGADADDILTPFMRRTGWIMQKAVQNIALASRGKRCDAEKTQDEGMTKRSQFRCTAEASKRGPTYAPRYHLWIRHYQIDWTLRGCWAPSFVILCHSESVQQKISLCNRDFIMNEQKFRRKICLRYFSVEIVESWFW